MDTIFFILLAILPFAIAYSLFKYHKKGRLKFGIKQNLDSLRICFGLVVFSFMTVITTLLLVMVDEKILSQNIHYSSALGYWLIHTGLGIFQVFLLAVVVWKSYWWFVNLDLFKYSEQEQQWIKEGKEKDKQWIKSKLSWLGVKKNGIST